MKAEMFTMTASAVEAINQLTTAQEVQAEGGLRFALDSAPEAGTTLIVDVVARATEGDDVIETAGAQVFLARDTRLQLAGKVLDVRKDIDGHYTFLVTSPLCNGGFTDDRRE